MHFEGSLNDRRIVRGTTLERFRLSGGIEHGARTRSSMNRRGAPGVRSLEFLQTPCVSLRGQVAASYFDTAATGRSRRRWIDSEDRNEMKTTIEWQGDVQFTGTSGSGHSVSIDGPPESGGKNAGPRPMELVLMGTAGCSAYDVVHILKRQRQDVTGCRAHVEAERAENPPRVFTRIHMKFEVEGRNLDDKKVGRAVSLSAEKYCSASIMLTRGGVEIEHSYTVLQTPEADT